MTASPAPSAAQVAAETQPEASSDRPADSAPAEGDEKPECGFCTYMKGGGCKSAFEAWEACVEECREKESDFSANCHQQTMALQTCMMKNKEYYEPLLEEEERYTQAAVQSAVQEGVEAVQGGINAVKGVVEDVAEDVAEDVKRASG